MIDEGEQVTRSSVDAKQERHHVFLPLAACLSSVFFRRNAILDSDLRAVFVVGRGYCLRMVGFSVRLLTVFSFALALVALLGRLEYSGLRSSHRSVRHLNNDCFYSEVLGVFFRLFLLHGKKIQVYATNA